MEQLPLVRLAEVAFLASSVKECLDFYRKIGMTDLPPIPGRLNFASVVNNSTESAMEGLVF